MCIRDSVGIGENSGLDIAPASNGGLPFMADDIIGNANEAYKKSLSFTTPFSIEFEYRGFDALAPYQCFTFDASTPDNIEKPESAGTAGIYRPTSVRYDAKRDVIKVKAYLIGNV